MVVICTGLLFPVLRPALPCPARCPALSFALILGDQDLVECLYDHDYDCDDDRGRG